MEEKKNQQAKKLSYEELNKAASDLYVQYQKLVGEHQKALQALKDRDFDYTSFFIQMLFKAIEHAEMYSSEFIKWAVENVESILTGFAEGYKAGKEEGEAKEEKTDEAE